MRFSAERLGAELERRLRNADPQPAGCCVALSGGLDSTVLLAALVAAGASSCRPLRAVHVDHGLHPDAADWSRQCLELARRLGVPCEVARVDARPAAGESPEAAARAARYAVFADRLKPGEALLTAHHADDQLETVLLQWLRGGGLRAVAGMQPMTRFAGGWLVRPLLDYTRDELAAWAAGQELRWLEDPSNADPRFDRNYLRLEVLPRLRERWPAAARTVGRVAVQAAGALEIEAQVAQADLGRLEDGATLALDGLAALPPARQRLVLRAWLRKHGLEPPAAATLEALRHDMLGAGAARIPATRWPGAVVRRYRGRLFAEAVARDGGWQPGRWRPQEPFALDDRSRLELVAATGVGLSRDRLPGELLVLKRPPGARFRPAGSAHHRELRKWLQERGVLPWRRDTLPCVVAGDEIVAIGDLACGGALAAAPGEPSWRIAWHGRPLLTEAEALAAGSPAP